MSVCECVVAPLCPCACLSHGSSIAIPTTITMANDKEGTFVRAKALGSKSKTILGYSFRFTQAQSLVYLMKERG